MRYPFDGSYPVTQKFGANPTYYKQFGFDGHEGEDFGTPNGVKILACAKGKVVRRNDVKDGAYGIYVVVWHEELLLATWYCHLQSNVVSIGDTVTEGQLIAYSDNTGNTTGPHLHLNLCQTDKNGYRINQDNGYKGFIDPAPYLSTSNPQNELEQCKIEREQNRLDRDKNWNLHLSDQEQIKELQKQLEGVKKENKELWDAIKKFAADLGVSPSTEIIGGEIVKLINMEDEHDRLVRAIADKDEAISKLQDENKTLEASNQQNLVDKKDAEDRLKSCTTGSDTLKTTITELSNKLEKINGTLDTLPASTLLGLLIKKIAFWERSDT